MAGPNIAVQVTGLNELIRDLQALGIDVSDMKEVFGSLARDAAGLAKGFAPVLTGRLERNIRGNRAKNKAIVRAGGKRLPYAGALNYGTGPRIGKTGPHNIAASQFMQRASHTIEPTVHPRLEREINRLIEERDLD